MTEKTPQSGDGIRSLRTSSVFRALNFELYVRPNLAIMILGGTVMAGCMGYIAYMRYSYEGKGYYAAVQNDGSEQFMKKKSRWD